MFGIHTRALTIFMLVLGPHLSPQFSCAAAAISPSLPSAPPLFESTILDLDKRNTYTILGWTLIWETSTIILPPSSAVPALSNLFRTIRTLAISKRHAAAAPEPALLTRFGAFTFTMFSATAVDSITASGIGIPWRLIESVAMVLLRITQLGAPGEVRIRCSHPASPDLVVWVLVKIAEAAPAA